MAPNPPASRPLRLRRTDRPLTDVSPIEDRPLILASASPRRQELMRLEGYAFTVAIPPVHEPELMASGVSAAQQAEALSYFKARSVAARFDKGVIIAAEINEIVGRLPKEVKIYTNVIYKHDDYRILPDHIKVIPQNVCDLKTEIKQLNNDTLREFKERIISNFS